MSRLSSLSSTTSTVRDPELWRRLVTNGQPKIVVPARAFQRGNESLRVAARTTRDRDGRVGDANGSARARLLGEERFDRGGDRAVLGRSLFRGVGGAHDA